MHPPKCLFAYDVAWRRAKHPEVLPLCVASAFPAHTRGCVKQHALA